VTTLVLHIGSPKCGSSAVQAATAASFSGKDWIALPPNPFSKPFPHGYISALYFDHSNLPRTLSNLLKDDQKKFRRDCLRYRQLIIDSLRPKWGAQPTGAFLSCEYLWRLSIPQILRLKADFQSYGIKRFIVISYVRHPSSLYGSALQQWSRLSSDLSRFLPAAWRYRFRDSISDWRTVFERDLVIRPFEPSQLFSGSVVSDLNLSVSQRISLSPGFPDLIDTKSINTSACVEMLLALHEVMRATEDSSARLGGIPVHALQRIWRRFSTLSINFQGSPVTVKPEIQGLIARRHQEDLEWLRESCFIRFDSDYLHSSLPDVDASLLDLSAKPQLLDFLDVSPDRELVDYCKSIVQRYLPVV